MAQRKGGIESRHKVESAAVVSISARRKILKVSSFQLLGILVNQKPIFQGWPTSSLVFLVWGDFASETYSRSENMYVEDDQKLYGCSHESWRVRDALRKG